jgi:hypothetical protein
MPKRECVVCLIEKASVASGFNGAIVGLTPALEEALECWFLMLLWSLEAWCLEFPPGFIPSKIARDFKELFFPV